MASLSDFSSVFQPPTQQPVGFGLADLALQQGLTSSGSGVRQERLLRNFSEFDLPDLLSGQAARGAFNSSATRNKVNKLATGYSDQLGDEQMSTAPILARLSANQLLATTGISL